MAVILIAPPTAFEQTMTFSYGSYFLTPRKVAARINATAR